MLRSRVSKLAVACTLATAVLSSPVFAAAAITDLPGRWSGWGSIGWPNGTAEQVKCVATYFLNDGGATLLQNLRCASQSYKIDATAKLTHNGGKLSGEWEEKTYTAKGAVSGGMTPEGFSLAIKGDTFTADMVVKSTNCKQSVLITPTGMEIAKITISLEKC